MLENIYKAAKEEGMRVLRNIGGDILLAKNRAHGRYALRRIGDNAAPDYLENIFFEMPPSGYMGHDGGSSLLYEDPNDLDRRIKHQGGPAEHSFNTACRAMSILQESRDSGGNGEVAQNEYRIHTYHGVNPFNNIFPKAFLDDKIVLLMPSYYSIKFTYHHLSEKLAEYGIELIVTTAAELAERPIAGVTPPDSRIIYDIINHIVEDVCDSDVTPALGYSEWPHSLPKGWDEDDWVAGIDLYVYHDSHYNALVRDKEYFFDQLRAKLGYVPIMHFHTGT